MPIDPQARAIVDEIGNIPDLDYAALPVDLIRSGFESMAARDVGEAVERVQDRSIPGTDGEIPVRLYTPSGAGSAAPVLVYFHGGGFVTGSVATHDALCRAFANHTPCAVLSVDYRLAPEDPFPAAVEDCHAAVRWVAENASSLGVDPQRIAVGGDSAGGNLAAATAQLCHDGGAPSLCHQLLLYPVMDNRLDTLSYEENAEGYLLTRHMMKWFWIQYLGDAAPSDDPRACPLHARSLAGLPPATVVTAGFDPLRDEGRAYAERLEKAGVPTRRLHCDGMIHGFLSWASRIDRARAVLEDLCGILRESFRASAHERPSAQRR